MIRKFLALLSIIAVGLVSVLALTTPAGATAPTGDASRLYVLTNNSRTDNGKGWIAWDQNLAGTAQEYANWLAARNNGLVHDVFLGDHIKAAVPGVTGYGENIAYTTSTNDPMWQMQNGAYGYMQSAGHKANILNNWDRVGIGVAKNGRTTFSVVRFATSSNKDALGDPVGSFDSASSPRVNTVRVGGWALDPDSTGSALIDVKVNGVVVSTQPAGASRPDIGTVFNTFGDNHGFDFVVSTIGGSTKSICIDVRNLGTYGDTVSLGCKNVAVVPDLSGPYYDVSGTHTWVDQIQWFKDANIATGFSDGTFRPTDTVSRQAMASFLWNYAGRPAPAPDAPTFSDVPAGSPFATAIRWMAGEGIASGAGDGTFRGNAALTRQAAASFLWKFADQPPVPAGAPSFSDVPAGNAFRPAIRWMAGVGITGGTTPTTFDPGGRLTRQTMAAFLFRFDNLPK